MKLSAIAAGLKKSGLLATDAADEKVIAALATMLAADKKVKDETPPKEKDDNAEDEYADMPEGMDERAWDAMSEEEKKEAKDKAAKDKAAKDAETDVQPKESVKGQAGPEPAKDKSAKDSKLAVDAAVKAALDARDALHAARRDVETVIGVVTYDSAAEVYKAALAKLGVAVDGIDPSAYGAIFKIARDKAAAATPVIASDASLVMGMASVIPGYNRLQ